MWPDNETTKDYLSYQIHADVVRGLVTDPSLSPLTVGLFGDWGGGKSSIIRMLQRDLDPLSDQSKASPDERKEYQKFACIYFNGWQLEGYDDSRAALLSSILGELGKLERFGPKLKEGVKELLKSVDWMRLARGITSAGAACLMAPKGALAAPIITGLFDAAESLQKSKVTLDQDHSAEVLDDQDASNGLGRVREFRGKFSKLLSDSQVEKLIVLVDDLDRCAPERLVDNLEAIKLFLNLGNTAFVIAADERIVRQAIALRYHIGTYENMNASDVDAPIVTDYLEKLIQIPYRIPRLSHDESLTYMNLLYCEKHLNGEDLQRCINIHIGQQIKNRYAPLTREMILDQQFGQQEEKSQDLARDLDICEAIAPVVTETLKGNPRQIKRFLNAFELRLQLAEKSHIDDIRRDVLAKLMVLEYLHSERYRELYGWQAASDGYPGQLELLEGVKPSDLNEESPMAKQTLPNGWDMPELLKWAHLVPSLRKIDLRSYFWLTRDALENPLDNTISMSPTLLKLVNDLLSGSDPQRIDAEKRAYLLVSSDASAVAKAVARSIAREPRESRGYQTLLSLGQSQDIYMNELVEVLQTTKAQDIPPSIVPTLDSYSRKKNTPVAPSVRTLLKKWAEQATTKVGRAAAAAMKGE